MQNFFANMSPSSLLLREACPTLGQSHQDDGSEPDSCKMFWWKDLEVIKVQTTWKLGELGDPQEDHMEFHLNLGSTKT